MKRIGLFIKTVEQSIIQSETPQKKMEQLEEAKLLAPKLLNGIWLELTLVILTGLESTIKLPQ